MVCVIGMHFLSLCDFRVSVKNRQNATNRENGKIDFQVGNILGKKKIDFSFPRGRAALRSKSKNCTDYDVRVQFTRIKISRSVILQRCTD